MANQPSKSLLQSVFAKSKAPAGYSQRLRKTTATNNSKRNSRRVRSFNNLSALNQKIITTAGTKEAYLRGTTTLAESRQLLRPQAIAIGVAKPYTPKASAMAAIIAIARHPGNVDMATLKNSVSRMTQAQRRRAEAISSYDDYMELYQLYQTYQSLLSSPPEVPKKKESTS